MGIDKTPCRGIYRITCKADLCNSEKDKISTDCIGCPSGLIEIIDLDEKVLNTIPGFTTKEEEKNKPKPRVSRIEETPVNSQKDS